MIQRIQTIYLLLAFSCIALLIWFPLFSVTAESNTEIPVAVSADFGAYGLIFTSQVESMEASNVQYTVFDDLADDPERGKFPVYIIYIVLAMFTFAGILSYKKRKRQLLFTRLALFLHVLVAIGIYAFYYLGTGAIKKALPETADLTITFGLEAGFYLMLASIPFLFLAIRGIKRDENLVKSLDRLR